MPDPTHSSRALHAAVPANCTVLRELFSATPLGILIAAVRQALQDRVKH